MKLEELTPGKVIAGVIPGKLVRIVAAEMRGFDELELVYRSEGAVSQRRLSRADEDRLVLTSRGAWPLRLSPWAIVVPAVLVVAVLGYRFWPASGFHLWWRAGSDRSGPGSNDIPVVMRTPGGMLEVATVTHKRTFNLTSHLVFIGIPVPFCRASASYTVDTKFTYRVRLAKDWGAHYRNGHLEVWAPPLEPALPVAFDTSKMKATLRSCPFIPGGTQDDLLQLVSAQLEKDARSPTYLQLAQNLGARDTVREFVRKWLITQKGYDIPANAPIDIDFQP